MTANDDVTNLLTPLLTAREEVVFAYLFGSAAQNRLRQDSDLDVAVYFANGPGLDLESPQEFPATDGLWRELERESGREVDLLILNRAPAPVCASALLTGTLMVDRDPALRTRFFLAATDAATAFLETEREYLDVRQRSNSLAPLDESRLRRIIQFIRDEMEDRPLFEGITLNEYRENRSTRRNLERWIETLITAAIDIGKIILASEHRGVPQTYGQILEELESLAHFRSLQGRLSRLASLRNLMAHEYLDLRFGKVDRFVETDAEAVEELATLTGSWMQRPRNA